MRAKHRPWGEKCARGRPISPDIRRTWSISRDRYLRSSKLIVYLLVLASLGSPGCFWVKWLPYPISPEVTLDADAKRDALRLTPTRVAAVQSPDSGVIPICANPEMQHAFAYAEYAKDQYGDAGKQYGSISGTLGVALIPMGAAAAGLGITGQSGVPVTSLGLAAATGLGLGTWLQSPPREATYAHGQLAIECILDVFQPYCQSECAKRQLINALYGIQYGATDNSCPATYRNSLQWYRVHLANLAASARLAVGLLEEQACSAHATPQLKGWLDNAEKTLQAAAIAGAAAEQADSAARAFIGSENGSSAMSMTHAVDTVNIIISDALRSSERDVQTLSSNLNSIIPQSARSIATVSSLKWQANRAEAISSEANADSGQQQPVAETLAKCADDADRISQNVDATVRAEQYYQDAQVAQGIEPLAVPGPGASSAEKILWMVQRVSDDTLILSNRVKLIAHLIGADRGAANSDTCKKLAQQSGSVTPLSVTPSSRVEMKPGDTKDLIISGGTPPYSSKVVGNALAGLTTRVIDDSGTQAVEISSAAPSGAGSDSSRIGDTAVFVTDKAGVGVTVDVSVTAKSEKPGTPSGGASQGGGSPAGAKLLVPRTFKFPEQEWGTTLDPGTPQTITLSNSKSSKTSVTVSGLEIKPGGDFSILSTDCKREIKPKETCRVQVKPTPVALPARANLIISEKSPSPAQTVGLEVAQKQPPLSFSSTTITLRKLAGGHYSAAVNVVNHSTVVDYTLKLSHPAWSGYSLSGCAGTLNKSAGCTVTISYAAPARVCAPTQFSISDGHSAHTEKIKVICP